MAFKTEAIVLHHRTLRDADRMYTVLSPRDGVLQLIAKGAARSTSKMAGHLKPFAHVRLMVGRGRQDYVAGADTIDAYRELSETWFDFILASSLVELTLTVNVPGPAAYEEFQLLRDAFEHIRKYRDSQRHKAVIGRIYLWKLLALSGWQPAIGQCAICRETFAGHVLYRPVTGFVCPNHGVEGRDLDQQFVTFLISLATDQDWNALIARAIESDFDRQWFDVSQSYYQDIVSRSLQSVKLFAYV